MQILDISSPKEDVLVNFVASRNLHSIFLSPFGPKGPHIAQADAGLLGVDVVEDALVPDLALGGQADEAPDVRLRGPGRPAAGAGGGRGRRPLGRGGGRRRRRRWRFRRHGRRGIPGRARLGLGMRGGAGREGEGGRTKP